MLLSKAQEIRKVNFADDVTFVYSEDLINNEKSCGDCSKSFAHNVGHYFRETLFHPEDQLDSVNFTSNCCTQVGLVSEYQAKKLAASIETVVFDFVACNDTIKNVYGVNDITSDDFLTSYRALQRHLNVIPRLCIGLNGGDKSGEISALTMLSKENPAALAFIVYTSDFSDQVGSSENTPKLDYILDILIQARIMFPETTIHLGCMRPNGKYRNALDYWALQAGVNRIVAPAVKAREYAEASEYNIYWKDHCWEVC